MFARRLKEHLLKTTFEDRIALLDFQMAKHVIEQPQVTTHEYSIMQPKRDKYWFLHVPLHQEE
jgi:hypothetical protein